MRVCNSSYCNTYTVTIKLTASLIFVVFMLLGCEKQSKQLLTVEYKDKDKASRLNLNTATIAEIEKLPEIGPQLAARIVEHREKFGPFRNPAQVILVRGMSDGRFRRIRELISAE